MIRTANIAVSLQRLSILRIQHPQANPLTLACTLRAGETLPSGLAITAEIHTSRNVAAETAPLASSSVTVAADATSFDVSFTSAQLNQTVTPDSTRALWLVVYGVGDADQLYTLAAADLLLGWHAISTLTADPPATSILVEKGGVAWASGRSYVSGTVVTVGATAYVCTTDNTSTTDDEPGVGAEWESFWVVLSGGGGGVTNLSATASPTGVVIASDTGDDATISAADGTNAGLMLPAEKTKLAGVATGATANATDAQLRARGTHTGTQAIATIDNLQASLDGKADLVDGKLNTSQLPDLAVTQYLGTAANQSAMLLLVGQRGDWCIRTDDGKVYIVTGEPSSTLGNWTSMSYPTAPVLSVAGRTGSVTLSSGDISGLGALATLSSVGTAQITDGAVTQVKLWSGFVNGTKALPSWSARDNQPPATAFATIDTRNGQYVLDFDDGAAGANERAVFAGIIPAEFSLTGGFKVRVHWWASSINTAHRVKWTAEVDRRNTDASTDSGAWGSIHSALGPPDGTQFKPTFTEITLTSIDGLVAGEPFRLRITRDAADSANDTMSGDAELFGVQIIGN